MLPVLEVLLMGFCAFIYFDPVGKQAVLTERLALMRVPKFPTIAFNIFLRCRIRKNGKDTNVLCVWPRQKHYNV